MVFRRRTSVSTTTSIVQWEATSPRKSPVDSQTRDTLRSISLSLDGMCAKAKGNPDNALSKSALALRDIFNISKVCVFLYFPSVAGVFSRCGAVIRTKARNPTKLHSSATRSSYLTGFLTKSLGTMLTKRRLKAEKLTMSD